MRGRFLLFVFMFGGGWDGDGAGKSVCMGGGGGENQPFSFGHDHLEMSIAHPGAVADVQSRGSDRKEDRSFVLSQIFIENPSCARSYSRLWRYL